MYFWQLFWPFGNKSPVFLFDNIRYWFHFVFIGCIIIDEKKVLYFCGYILHTAISHYVLTISIVCKLCLLEMCRKKTGKCVIVICRVCVWFTNNITIHVMMMTLLVLLNIISININIKPSQHIFHPCQSHLFKKWQGGVIEKTRM